MGDEKQDHRGRCGFDFVFRRSELCTLLGLRIRTQAR